jgi:hypothetical protein
MMLALREPPVFPEDEGLRETSSTDIPPLIPLAPKSGPTARNMNPVGTRSGGQAGKPRDPLAITPLFTYLS